MNRSFMPMLALVILASAASAASVRPPATHVSTQHPRGGWMARAANPHHPWIYVSGYNSNNVLIYDLSKFGPPQIGAITAGVKGPRDITLDPAGNLYVANTNGGNVTVYPPGATTPSLTLSQGLNGPVCATVDAKGNVWVTNHGNPASIVIYPAGQTTPSQTITDPLIKSPEQLAFDAAGNAIFGDDTTGVSEIPAGSAQPQSLHLKNLPTDATEGIALDPHRGAIFVSFGYLTNHINVYLLRHERPARSLSAPTADGLAGGVFLKHNVVFIPGSQTSTVTVYRDNATTALATFGIGTSYTRGAAYKPPSMP